MPSVYVESSRDRPYALGARLALRLFHSSEWSARLVRLVTVPVCHVNEPNPRVPTLMLDASDPHFAALLVHVLHFRARLKMFLV